MSQYLTPEQIALKIDPIEEGFKELALAGAMGIAAAGCDNRPAPTPPPAPSQAQVEQQPGDIMIGDGAFIRKARDGKTVGVVVPAKAGATKEWAAAQVKRFLGGEWVFRGITGDNFKVFAFYPASSRPEPSVSKPPVHEPLSNRSRPSSIFDD